MSTYSYKGHENLENIGCDFPNYSNEYVKNFRDNIYKLKKRKEKYEIDENNKNINYSSSQYLLINRFIMDCRKVNKKIFLRNNTLKSKNNNVMLQTNNNNLNSTTEKSKIYWHNEILQKLITNINKNNNNPNMIFKNVALSEDNFNFPQKIRMSTLLNLYNNWNNKSI